jgi:tetratricopeptide (TPR) repeat protein
MSKESHKIRRHVNGAASAGDGACSHYEKHAFWLVAVVVLAALVVVAPQVGINADEGEIDGTHGKYCLAYYADGDTSFANYPAAGVMQALQPEESIYLFQKYFGVGFEILPAIALRYLGLPPQWEFEFRHILCALLGWLLMLCTGLIGRELGGYKLGLLTLIAMACTPTIFGWSVQDAKDTPFAAGFALALLGMLRIFGTFPKIKPIDAAAAAAGIGMAVSIRIGGLMLLLYAAAGLLLWLLFNAKRVRMAAIYPSILLGMAVCLAGALLGLCFYPNFFYAGAVRHISEALSFVHNHPLNVLMTWDGRFISSNALPPYYLWKAYALTLPPFALLGLALAAFNCKRIFSGYSRFKVWLLLFCAAFPIAYLLLTKSPIYQGWKHTMFAYSAAAPFIALGYYECARRWRPKRMLWLHLWRIAPALCLLPTVVWLVQNNKYGYAYYNFMAGNVHGRYDQDHLFTAVSRSFEWLRQHELRDSSRQYTIATISFGLGGYQASKRYPNIILQPIDELHYTPNDCDYAILHTKCINYETLKRWWLPQGTIHAEYISGHAVCAVIKKNPDEALGVRYLRSGQPDSALRRLQAAYDHAPQTIDLWYWLGLAHYNLQQYDDAIKFFNKDVNIKSIQAHYGGDSPALQADALSYIGLSRMAQKRYEDAAKAFEAIEYAYKRKGYVMPKHAAGNLGVCLYYMGKYQAAAPYLEYAVKEFPHLHSILQECRAR